MHETYILNSTKTPDLFFPHPVPLVPRYSRGWGPFTQQGVRAKEQVNLSIEVPLVPQVPFRGTSSYRAHTSKRYLVPSCCMVGVGWMTCPTTTTTAVKFHFFALDDAL